ncbi:hypothetical protein LZ554_000714 [Drepanopeziza brunnea f. sp. 'monogermtubi']|nr:hypothetical protein LZ554_000714 [Drepanopeziza brunnea f. sp. 'monogermtubi']
MSRRFQTRGGTPLSPVPVIRVLHPALRAYTKIFLFLIITVSKHKQHPLPHRPPLGARAAHAPAPLLRLAGMFPAIHRGVVVRQRLVRAVGVVGG